MTYTHCPHKVPSLDDDRGWYCSRSGKCFWPKCDRADPLGGASHGSGNASQKLSYGSHLVSDSSDSHIENSESSDPNPSDQPKFSYGSRPAKVWQTVGPYKNKGREYFRYQWGIGGQVRETIHIPGGSRSNPVAVKRAREVWIGIHKRGWSVEQTKEFISPWRGHRARL